MNIFADTAHKDITASKVPSLVCEFVQAGGEERERKGKERERIHLYVSAEKKCARQ